MQLRISAILAACGAATVASAQPVIITGSGATLQENFFRSPASTNDFIDVDGDGISGARNSFFPDQLAQDRFTNPSPFWFFHYRVTGSGNGITEFDTFGAGFDQNPDLFDTDMDGSTNDDLGNSSFADAAIWNREDILDAGSNLLVPPGVAAHRSGMPLVPNGDNGFRGQLLNTMDPDNGFRVDFAASDVPLAWFAIIGGESRPSAVPGASGYGSNPRTAVDKTGTPVDQPNALAALENLNVDVNNPDALTVYEFPFAITPVAAIVNYGVGRSEMYMSDLRHLTATGRTLTGDNLMYVSRDTGSGTHNTFHNGIGLDPSYGVGENIGLRTTSSANDALGPIWQPSNKGGSSRNEGTTRNHRLAIGHTGASRGVTSGWLINGQLDVLGIASDIKGGTVFARPNNANTLDGGVDGYNIVGPAGLSVLGDPRNGPANLGGWGWDPEGFFDGRGPDGVLGTADDETAGNNPFASNPVPANPGVTGYINNILRSLALFEEVPDAPELDFMPGEQIASQFISTAAPSFVPLVAPSTQTQNQPLPIVANPEFNQAIQNFAASNNNDPLANPAFNAFNNSTAGRVPTRTAGVAYSDSTALGGSATGAFYVNQAGNAVNYGDPLGLRNKIAGDFNGDEVRDADDAVDMIRAFEQRSGGATWVAPAGSGPSNGGTAGSTAVIEILGDFTGDGNFGIDDIRYFADGLVLNDNGLDVLPVTPSGVGDGTNELTLDRLAGFTAVDNASLTVTGNLNFFDTALATGAAYEAGDSVADVAGSGGFTRGFVPIGADGRVDLDDIDYVCANQGDWTVLEQAINMDLSCDMNGDLVVDSADIDFVIETVLETVRGDFDLDGDKDAADRAIITANLGTGTLYSEGDFDCDGDVDAADLAAFDGQCNDGRHRRAPSARSTSTTCSRSSTRSRRATRRPTSPRRRVCSTSTTCSRS
jgi:hypothetical protein